MKRIWQDHSFLVVTGVMSIIFLIVFTWFGWEYHVDNAEEHGQKPDVQAFIIYWLQHIGGEFIGETIIGLFGIAILAKMYREKGSPETGDDG